MSKRNLIAQNLNKIISENKKISVIYSVIKNNLNLKKTQVLL